MDLEIFFHPAFLHMEDHTQGLFYEEYAMARDHVLRSLYNSEAHLRRLLETDETIMPFSTIPNVTKLCQDQLAVDCITYEYGNFLITSRLLPAIEHARKESKTPSSHLDRATPESLYQTITLLALQAQVLSLDRVLYEQLMNVATKIKRTKSVKSMEPDSNWSHYAFDGSRFIDIKRTLKGKNVISQVALFRLQTMTVLHALDYQKQAILLVLWLLDPTQKIDSVRRDINRSENAHGLQIRQLQKSKYQKIWKRMKLSNCDTKSLKRLRKITNTGQKRALPRSSVR